jgi:hypothetical protein
MNEFLLLAVTIVYLAICYRAPIAKTGNDGQRLDNKHFEHPAEKNN